ncbi:MAG: glycosyltransferase family 9 protein [Sphingobacteriaceae bacterium]|jgi:ADP-heptose:LPS heptosyltransferase
MKVLVVRFSSIGDIVLTTPVIRGLKKQLGAEVHYLTKSNFQEVLAANPNIDQIHLLNHTNWSEIVSKLKAEKFDYIIDLHHNVRTLKLKLALGVKAFSFDKLNIQKWLLVNLKINRMPALHIVDRYLACVKSIGVNKDLQGLDYFIGTNDEVLLSSLPIAFQNGYIGLVIGAQHFTKRLPKEKLNELLQRLTQPVVILGGPTDAELAEELSKIAPNRIYNACGKYNLNQSASLVKQAQKIICNDTGLMHIAAAFQKEIHLLWGNTIPAFGMGPYAIENAYHYEVPHLNCRPCSKIGFQQCPKGHFHCMNQQDITKLINQLS